MPNPLRFDPQVKRAMEVYVRWLNDHFEMSMGARPHKVEHFDSRHNEHGFTKVELDKENVFDHTRMIVLSVYDGDDGGPAGLLVLISGDEIQNLIQTFDTYTSTIINSWAYVDPRKEK